MTGGRDDVRHESDVDSGGDFGWYDYLMELE